jgi:hypothetical protein
MTPPKTKLPTMKETTVKMTNHSNDVNQVTNDVTSTTRSSNRTARNRKRTSPALLSKRVVTAATVGLTLGITGVFSATNRAEAGKANPTTPTTSPTRDEELAFASMQETPSETDTLDITGETTTDEPADTPQEVVVRRRIHVLPDPVVPTTIAAPNAKTTAKMVESNITRTLVRTKRFTPRAATAAPVKSINRSTARRQTARERAVAAKPQVRAAAPRQATKRVRPVARKTRPVRTKAS